MDLAEAIEAPSRAPTKIEVSHALADQSRILRDRLAWSVELEPSVGLRTRHLGIRLEDRDDRVGTPRLGCIAHLLGGLGLDLDLLLA